MKIQSYSDGQKRAGHSSMVTKNSGTFKIKKSESTNKIYVVRDAFN